MLLKMNKVKLVAILFMAVVVLFFWQKSMEDLAVSIWGRPCRILINNALVNADQLVATVIAGETNAQGEFVEKKSAGRYFVVEKEFCQRVIDKDPDIVFQHQDDKLSYPWIKGRCIESRPTLARLVEDDRQGHENLQYGIVGSVVVVIIGLAFLKFHGRRLAQKAMEKSATENTESTEK
jgi:hypothetical protein